MKLIFTDKGKAYLHGAVWDLVDTMGPDGSIYHQEGSYVVFSGHSSSEAASWLFRLASQAKTEILTIFLQDVPAKDDMILLARLMCELEAYLGGYEGSLFLYWLEGVPNAKMDARHNAEIDVQSLDRSMHQRRGTHRAIMDRLAKMDAATQDTHPR